MQSVAASCLRLTLTTINRCIATLYTIPNAGTVTFRVRNRRRRSRLEHGFPAMPRVGSVLLRVGRAARAKCVYDHSDAGCFRVHDSSMGARGFISLFLLSFWRRTDLCRERFVSPPSQASPVTDPNFYLLRSMIRTDLSPCSSSIF